MRIARFSLLAILSWSCAASEHGSQKPVTGVTSFLVIDSSIRLSDGLARAVDIDRFSDVYVLRPNAVTKYSWFGDSLRSVSGVGSGHYEFNDATDLDARYPNTILIADRLNHRVEIYSRELAYLATLYTRDDPDPARRFGYPRAAAADRGGNMFVLDGENNRILKFRSDRRYERTFGGYSESTRPEAVLAEPRTMAVDDAGDVIVLDRAGRSLVTFDNFGSLVAREPLPIDCSRLATSSDTIFVLSSHASGGDSLFRYGSPSLVSLGTASRDLTRLSGKSVTDVSIRATSGVLLDGSFLSRFHLIPRFAQPK